MTLKKAYLVLNEASYEQCNNCQHTLYERSLPYWYVAASFYSICPPEIVISQMRIREPILPCSLLWGVHQTVIFSCFHRCWRFLKPSWKCDPKRFLELKNDQIPFLLQILTSWLCKNGVPNYQYNHGKESWRLNCQNSPIVCLHYSFANIAFSSFPLKLFEGTWMCIL